MTPRLWNTPFHEKICFSRKQSAVGDNSDTKNYTGGVQNANLSEVAHRTETGVTTCGSQERGGILLDDKRHDERGSTEVKSNAGLEGSGSMECLVFPNKAQSEASVYWFKTGNQIAGCEIYIVESEES